MLTDDTCRYERKIDNFSVTCLVTGAKWKQNAYIVSDIGSNKCIVIDPGDTAEMISDLLLQHGLTLLRILLTHPHYDHVGGVDLLSKSFNVTCELHSADVALLKHAPMYAKTFAGRNISPVKDYRAFDELVSHDADISIRSLHTPGHTKGSVCYLFKGFTFTGDTLMYKHIGRTDLPGGNAEDLPKSVDELLFQLSDDNILFPGHGKPWTVGEAKTWWRNNNSMPSRQGEPAQR